MLAQRIIHIQCEGWRGKIEKSTASRRIAIFTFACTDAWSICGLEDRAGEVRLQAGVHQKKIVDVKKLIM